MTIHRIESSAGDLAKLVSARRGEIVATARNARMYFFGQYVTYALDGINFQVLRGEVFGLFGPEWCGKSTMLRLLAGVLKPSEGKIRVFGRAINHEKLAKLAKPAGLAVQVKTETGNRVSEREDDTNRS
jgi:ABC-type multidrug transport system ATPase subunit